MPQVLPLDPGVGRGLDLSAIMPGRLPARGNTAHVAAEA
jgi:hypothetical protein